MKDSIPREFWQDRAKKVVNGTVNLDESTSFTVSPDRVEQDWKAISSLISLTGLPRPLIRCVDLGCGTGRITERLVDVCGCVHGIDYMQDFIDVAAARCPKATFQCLPVERWQAPFNPTVAVISGVFVYLNDAGAREVVESLKGIPFIVVRESVGVSSRVDLGDDHFSKELDHVYGGVYRTVAELVSLFNEHDFCLYSQPLDVSCHRRETAIKAFLFQRQQATPRTE